MIEILKKNPDAMKMLLAGFMACLLIVVYETYRYNIDQAGIKDTVSIIQSLVMTLTAVFAVILYSMSIIFSIEEKRIQNIELYIGEHRLLFEENGYIMENIEDWESGNYPRDKTNKKMESKFHKMLLSFERMAILAKDYCQPSVFHIYMLGDYARHVKCLLDKEKKDPHWILALEYIDKLCAESEKFRAMDTKQRADHLRRIGII